VKERRDWLAEKRDRAADQRDREVEARSTTDPGSSFWVELPTKRAPVEGQPTSHVPAIDIATTSSWNRTVLYIEDNLSNVRLMEQIVARRPGLDLLVARHGRKGLEMALAHRPDLILLDLHLPDISGEDVLRGIRADPRTAAIPIVILSADTTIDRPQRLIAQGASAYLAKPFNIARVLDEIDHISATWSVPPPPEAFLKPEAPQIESQPESTSTANSAKDPQLVVNDRDVSTPTLVHDLINLLGVIVTYCDLLSIDETQPSRIAYLEQLGLASERAVEITRELLTARHW
jgi:CheY-like chemotaxis protein